MEMFTDRLKVAVRVCPPPSREVAAESKRVVYATRQAGTVEVDALTFVSVADPSICASSPSAATSSAAVTVESKPNVFAYEFVYEPADGQDAIYDDVGAPMLRDALEGYNGCVLAMGQTGTGKSYTLSGTGDSPGILPRFLEALFANVSPSGGQGDEERDYVTAWVSYCEVNGEELRDLLTPSGDPPTGLKVLDHPTIGVCVPGLVEVPCRTKAEVEQLLVYAARRRALAATVLNAAPSRSSTLFSVRVRRTLANGADSCNIASSSFRGQRVSVQQVSSSGGRFGGGGLTEAGSSSSTAPGATTEPTATSATVIFADLAGSERMARPRVESPTLRAGYAVSQSLSSLGTVIRALGGRQAPRSFGIEVRTPGELQVTTVGYLPHKTGTSSSSSSPAVEAVAPFRASKLTLLLRDALAGTARSFMVATVSPSRDDIEETLHTLRFASYARKLGTNARQNFDRTEELMLSLHAEIKRLKQRLSSTIVSPSEGLGTEAEMQEDIAQREMLLWQLRRPYEKQLEDSVRLHSMQDEALANRGLRTSSLEEVALDSNAPPFLLNASEEPSLAGSLVFPLRQDGATTVGAASDNDIVLAGLGIPDYLCQIETLPAGIGQPPDLTISLQPSLAGSATIRRIRVRVNGERLVGTERRRLQHLDGIIFGRALAVRVVVPAEQRAADRGAGGSDMVTLTKGLCERDLLLWLSPESSEAWGELRLYFEDLWQRLGQERGAAFFHWLGEASHLTDEANEITMEIRPADRLKFEVELVWDIQRSPRDIIVIRMMQFPDGAGDPTLLCYWTLQTFKERVDMMRECYDIFHRRGDWRGRGDPLEDPWLDPSLSEVYVRMYTYEQEDLPMRARGQATRRAQEELQGEGNNTGSSATVTAASSGAAGCPTAKAPSRASSPQSRGGAVAATGVIVGGGDSGAGHTTAAESVATRGTGHGSVKMVGARRSPGPAAKSGSRATKSTSQSAARRKIFGEKVSSLPSSAATSVAGDRGHGSSHSVGASAAASVEAPAAAMDATAATVEEAFAAQLRQQLRDQEDLEAMYKEKIAALTQRLAELSQAHGPLVPQPAQAMVPATS